MDLLHSQTVVIKIGSSTIFDTKQNEIKYDWLDTFAKDLVRLKEIDIYPIILCSGAVVAGKPFILNTQPFDKLLHFKIAGALGQQRINEAWISALASNNLSCIPLILSSADLKESEIAKILLSLIYLKKTPLLNENIPFQNEHNNDYLALEVAKKINADHFIILTDTDGIFDKNPKLYPDAKQIPIIYTHQNLNISNELTDASIGTGGVSSKLQCGIEATKFGIQTTIINGTHLFPISQALEKRSPHTLISKMADSK